MTLAFQLGLAYGLLAVLATAFSLLMLYWHFKKPVKKIPANAPIFFRQPDCGWCEYYIQLPSGDEIGPFDSYADAENYKISNE